MKIVEVQSRMFQALVREELAAHRNLLRHISTQIWDHPETLYEEFFAHDLLTSVLETHNFQVEAKFGGISTAFRAECSSKNFNPRIHHTVGIICEYDALPVIGHACGHNLIATAGIAAALVLKRLLKSDNTNDHPEVNGKVVILGTPAEEGGVGKLRMLKKSAFAGVECAMMVHPFPSNDLKPLALGINDLQVEFYGKSAHASCGPWDGKNALDGAIAAYNHFSLLRQQIPHDHRIGCTIAHGGTTPNAIPEFAKLSFLVRAQKQADLHVLTEKVTRCCEAGAEAAGCSVDVKNTLPPVCGILHNEVLCDLFQHYAAGEGILFSSKPSDFYGSTDMGCVSAAIPSIHPCYAIGKAIMIHTEEFREMARTEEAFDKTLSAAASLAMTTLHLFRNSNDMLRAKAEFLATRSAFLGKDIENFNFTENL
ncbi:xaa-Arg dipeptidase-like [Paramacrobiotus metropolitanus]|uniref:xaa-Arg dipeptidase-like n=1 Tax=Paramacrobiotus metropolitanus TaxID=2943436 RepID=UPI002445AE2F|nr:xaa-Arg dipeptidase-like [Paramacrobiotus metropolitanus]